MIHLSHSVSGGQVGTELGHDEEELAYALKAIADVGPDLNAVADYLKDLGHDRVLALCQELAQELST